MGFKSVCLECRKALNRSLDPGADRQYPCSECGKAMIVLSHRFRPPKKSDDKKWDAVKYLVDHGFYYDHVYQKIETLSNGVTIYENYVPYPENIKDAIEFVKKYRQQAKNSP